MTGPDPAAIQFMLEHLHESARWSDYFLYPNYLVIIPVFIVCHESG